MKQIKTFWKQSDKLFLLPLIFSLLTAAMITFPLLIFYDKLPPTLPLFYSLSWGETQLVSKEQFFILPGTVLAITLANTLFSSQLHSAQFLLKRMLMLNLVLVDLIALITAIKILSIFI